MRYHGELLAFSHPISLAGPYLDDPATRQERDDGVPAGDQKAAEVNGIREAGLLCGTDDDLRHP